jgi:hypothetical protein
LGCTSLITHVKINSNQPINASYYKAQRPEIREEISNQTDGMIADGVVKESESPYCAPIVLVKKRMVDGDIASTYEKSTALRTR